MCLNHSFELRMSVYFLFSELLEKGETCKTTEDCKAGLRCAISSSSNCKDNGYNENDEECQMKCQLKESSQLKTFQDQKIFENNFSAGAEGETCGKNEGECGDGLTCTSGVCSKVKEDGEKCGDENGKCGEGLFCETKCKNWDTKLGVVVASPYFICFKLLIHDVYLLGYGTCKKKYDNLTKYLN